jgi:hypothetical protein
MNDIISDCLLKQYIIYESLELFSIPEMTDANKICFDLSVKAPREVIVTLSCPVQFYFECSGFPLHTCCGGGNRYEFILVRYERRYVPHSQSVDWLTNKIFVDPEIEYQGEDIVYVLDFAKLFHYYQLRKYYNYWTECYGKTFFW